MGLKCWNANCDGHTEPNLLIAASPASAPATASGSTAARTETVQYAMGEMVHHAVACPLIDALPVEIRVQIYEYMLFENGSFFSLEDEEGNSVPTLFPKLRAPSKKRGQPPVLSVTGGGARDPQAIGSGRRGNIMSLLLVNKQIYDESASLLYSTSFFRLRGIHSTIQFINTVSPAHLALVRSLKLVWDDQGWTQAPEYDTPTLRLAWPSLCDALATSLTGLRNLYVALGMPSAEDHVEELYLGARGLAGVGHAGLDNFKVCVPVGFLARHYGLDKARGEAPVQTAGQEQGQEQEQEQAPFVLCRHTAGEVCDVRREVIRAEWRGDSRPSTPKLRVDVPANAPGLEPWADAEWEREEKDGHMAL